MKRLERCVDECNKVLTPGNSVWAAVASNNLNDIGGGYPKTWKSMIEKTKSSLLTKGVESSDLGINFRNSNEIFETSTNISKDQSDYNTTVEVQQVLDVTKKGSTISSSQPTLYNFHWVMNRGKQEDLDNAASLSLQELKKRMNDSENESYLVLYDEDYFSIEKVYNAIRKIEH